MGHEQVPALCPEACLSTCFCAGETRAPRSPRGSLVSCTFTLALTLHPLKKNLDIPGGIVGKNLSANAGDTSSIPGLGRFHMLRSN